MEQPGDVMERWIAVIGRGVLVTEANLGTGNAQGHQLPSALDLQHVAWKRHTHTHTHTPVSYTHL